MLTHVSEGKLYVGLQSFVLSSFVYSVYFYLPYHTSNNNLFFIAGDNKTVEIMRNGSASKF